jgi:flagellar assembly factor FliW
MTADHPHAVIEFPDGLPGFEGCRKFVIISGRAVEPFIILQGLGPGAPAFAAVDPLSVVGGYRPQLQESDLSRLQAGPDTPLLWLAIIALPTSGAPTANLRAPLVINPAALRGIQLIVGDSTYRVDHPLQAA